MHLVWLLPISFLGIWQLLSINQWPLAWVELIIYAPYAIAGLGIFIAFWLNRLQPVLILITLILFNLAIHYYFSLDRQGLTAQAIYPLLAILLPLNLFIWSLIPEKGLRNLTFFSFGFSFLLLQGVFLFWFLEAFPLDLIQWLAKSTPSFSQTIHLPLASLILTIVFSVSQIIKNALCRQLKVLDTTIIFVLVLMMIGLNQFSDVGSIAWVSSISALLILLSIIFDAHHMAYTDQLTGLSTRRALYEIFSGLGKHYSIAMMDIDHFKKFNDSYGHDIGDDVLCVVATGLQKIRVGKVFRFGGEEFTLVFKGKSPAEVKPYIEEIRELIASQVLKFDHKEKPTEARVTVSFGVAEKSSQFKQPEEVMKAADEALYQAKAAGRNKTMIYGEKPVTQKAKRIKQ